MEEVYLDLSDNIFIHKDLVEVIDLKITKGTTVVEALEQYIFDKKDKVVRFKISIWNGARLESIIILPEELGIILESKAKVVGLEYYWWVV